MHNQSVPQSTKRELLTAALTLVLLSPFFLLYVGFKTRPVRHAAHTAVDPFDLAVTGSSLSTIERLTGPGQLVERENTSYGFRATYEYRTNRGFMRCVYLDGLLVRVSR